MSRTTTDIASLVRKYQLDKDRKIEGKSYRLGLRRALGANLGGRLLRSLRNGKISRQALARKQPETHIRLEGYIARAGADLLERQKERRPEAFAEPIIKHFVYQKLIQHPSFYPTNPDPKLTVALDYGKMEDLIDEYLVECECDALTLPNPVHEAFCRVHQEGFADELLRSLWEACPTQAKEMGLEQLHVEELVTHAPDFTTVKWADLAASTQDGDAAGDRNNDISAPSMATDDPYYPCCHYTDVHISPSRLRKAKDKRQIGTKKIGTRNLYRDADVRARWPECFARVV